MIGYYMPITSDARSFACTSKKTARQTSHLQPMAHRKILCILGVICFLVAKAMTSSL